MRIIGKTTNGFILDAHADELDNLTGYYSAYHAPSGGYNREKFNLGDNIRIADMYQQLYRLSSLSSQVDQAKKTLTAAIELFSIVDPIVRHIVEEKSEIKENT